MNLRDIQLIVRMNQTVKHAGGGYPELTEGKVYRASFATNQPNWLAEQKVFVHPEMNGLEYLLAVTDGTFTVIGFALHSDIEGEKQAEAQHEREQWAAMERAAARQSGADNE